MVKQIFLILFIAAIAVTGWFFYEASQKEAAQPAAMQQAQAMAVSVLQLEEQNIALTQSLPARISPFRQSQVRPQVDGIITERLFEEGIDVEKGQQLYQIDDARYKAALNSALADLKSAEANIKTVEAKEGRYKELVKINAVSRQEYDDIKAQLDQAKASIAVAQAAVDVAQVNLGYTKVYAPISGRIGKSFVTEGALVTANQSQYLAVITQLDPVYIDMQQSGTEAIHLRNSMMGTEVVPVTIHMSETGGEDYPNKGALKFSEVTIDETTGSIALRALVSNPDDILLPGLFVRATLDLGTNKVLLVPQRATARTATGDLTVWIVDKEGKAQPRTLKVKQSYKDSWVVLSGVNSGDTVIVEGYQKVKEGMPVSTSPWMGKSTASK